MKDHEDRKLDRERYSLIMAQMELVAETYMQMGRQIVYLREMVDSMVAPHPSEKWDNRKEVVTIAHLFGPLKDINS